jgi:cation diffusion facilitator family transporter
VAGKTSERPITVYGAIISNLVIAVAKFVAAAFTGSSAMLSEGIHSLADTGNEMLLLLGLRRSDKPADELHPFGHGQEIYFWGLIVAMVLFGLGGGLSIYEGISHLLSPSTLEDPTWNYVVLAIGVLAEGTSWTIALRELLRRREEGESLWHAMRFSKDPSIFIVLGEDSAALIGLTLAFLGVFLSHRLEEPLWDGTASVAIGLVLVVVALYLAYESRNLLVGESADRQVVRRIREIALADPDVIGAETPLTMHLAPNRVLVNMQVEFKAAIEAQAVAAATERIRKQVNTEFSSVEEIFVKPTDQKGAPSEQTLRQEEEQR